MSRRGLVSLRTWSSAASRSGSPSPVRAETGIREAFSRQVPSSSVSTSAMTNSNHSSSSARSFLVMATTPASIPSRSKIDRCSRVCGMMPSSVATTNRAASIPPTPASIFLMKSLCPGTSTMPAVSPLGNSSHAKPKSMVISRSCSSLRRSGSMPVRAWTNVDFP